MFALLDRMEKLEARLSRGKSQASELSLQKLFKITIGEQVLLVSSTFWRVDIFIIGSDFLARFNLLPDIRHKCLIDGNIFFKVSAQLVNKASLRLTALADDCPYKEILSKRLCSEKLKAAKQEFEYMMQQGLCKPSKNPWASPLHLVQKKNSDWCLCGDYRKLNEVTSPDAKGMHVSGAENIVADVLSRVDTIVMPTSLDMQEIAEKLKPRMTNCNN
ncbi:hypothetical protein ALC56_04577 [Trachymyrmex septentrionalis]|uniref:Uncharacterized protein n=1 Tax=Trachymyrmex septentrionalis TaxID=34720 RepID=A0A195FLW9_9HYME|nr:hypothetical protein ALC56_04577 [Trachymyrmex septentrionalis]